MMAIGGAASIINKGGPEWAVYMWAANGASCFAKATVRRRRITQLDVSKAKFNNLMIRVTYWLCFLCALPLAVTFVGSKIPIVSVVALVVAAWCAWRGVSKGNLPIPDDDEPAAEGDQDMDVGTGDMDSGHTEEPRAFASTLGCDRDRQARCTSTASPSVPVGSSMTATRAHFLRVRSSTFGSPKA